MTCTGGVFRRSVNDNKQGIIYMRRKALFFDVDGTLLESMARKIPESTIRVISEASRQGHLIFINSGRTRCLLGDMERQLPVDGMLCGCGTYIESAGKVILHNVLTEERRREIQNLILDCKLDGILEGPEHCCVQEGLSHMGGVEAVKKLVDKTGFLISRDWRKDAVAFDKFCVLADENSDFPRFAEGVKQDITPIDRGGGLYECIPTGFDKGSAMRFVLEYFQVPWEDSYAFGDSMNDLAMIRYASHSILMGEHDAGLEPYADFITKKVSEDGIAYAFEKLGLLE